MTYQEYRKERQDAFNALPIFFAFGQEQFKKAMEERGLTEKDTDKVGRIAAGGFFLKKDADVIREYINRPDPLPELMKDWDFAVDAIYYEMCNHEYGINWDGDYDVCSCFGNIEYSEDGVADYFRQLGWEPVTQGAYVVARRRYFKNAEDGEWF